MSFFRKVNPNILAGGIDVMTFLPDIVSIEEEMKTKQSTITYDGQFYSRLEHNKGTMCKKMFTCGVKMLDNINRFFFRPNVISPIVRFYLRTGASITSNIDPLSKVVEGTLFKGRLANAIVSTIEWLEKECKDETGLDVFEEGEVKMKNANIGQSNYIFGQLNPQYNIPN